MLLVLVPPYQPRQKHGGINSKKAAGPYFFKLRLQASLHCSGRGSASPLRAGGRQAGGHRPEGGGAPGEAPEAFSGQIKWVAFKGPVEKVRVLRAQSFEGS